MNAATEKRIVEVLAFLGLVCRIVWIFVRDLLRALFPTEKSLAGEIVLITGAAQGMGRQVALNVSRLGARVVLWDLNEAKVKEAAEAIQREGGSATWYACDVTSENMVSATARKVEEEVGAVSILLNNAGIMQNVPMLQLDSDKIRLTFDVNVVSHFWTIRAFLPYMEKRNRGHIVALASGAGLLGYINQTDYSASKHAVVGMMEAFSEELRLKGSDIKTTTICPLTVNTGMNNHPCTKRSWLMPVLSIEDAANQIVSAIRREDFIVTIPSTVLHSLRFSRMCPRNVLLEVLDFVDYCRMPNTREKAESEKIK